MFQILDKSKDFYCEVRKMKKSTWILSLVALVVALSGVIIALIAFFKRRKCVLCDDYEDEMMPDFTLNPDVDLDDEEMLKPEDDGDTV